MRSIPLIVLTAGLLLAGWSMLEPEPQSQASASADAGWRRTVDGWERLPSPTAARAWYSAGLHPALVGLLLGQLAVGSLLLLPSQRQPRSGAGI